MPKRVLQIREPLSRGLSPNELDPKSDSFLTGAYGCRISPFGVSERNPLFQPTVCDISHPFPQLFLVESGGILAYEDSISLLNEHWEETAQTLYGTDVGSELLIETDVDHDGPLAAEWTESSSGPIFYDYDQDISAVNGSVYRIYVTGLAGGSAATADYRFTWTVAIGSDTHVIVPTQIDQVLYLKYTGTTGTATFKFRAYAMTSGGIVGADGIFSVKACDTGVITAGGPWELASFGEDYYLFNENTMVFNKSGIGLFVSDNSYAASGCAFKERLFLGGLGNFISSDWQTIYQTYAGTVQGEYFNGAFRTGDISFDQNVVHVSSVGYDDIAYYIEPLLLTRDKYTEQIRRRESLTIEMNWQGKVLNIKPLGEGVVVYGSDGITFLKLLSQVPVVASVEIADFGLMNRGSVGGDLSNHMFVDGKGNLWSLTSDLQLTKLDYSAHINSMSGEIITVNKDTRDNETYISNKYMCFLLTNSGMSRIPEKVNSIGIRDADVVAYYEEEDDLAFRVSTGIISADQRGWSTLVGIEVDTEHPRDFTVFAYHRKSSSEIFESSSFSLRGDGTVDIGLSGIEFIIELTADDSEGKFIRDIKVIFDDQKKSFGGFARSA